MAITFQEFAIPGARIYYGNPLPYGLQVTTNDNTVPPVEKSVEAIKEFAASGKLQQALDKHGAVLLRGFGHASAKTFSNLINAAEETRGYHPFEQIGLAGKRTPLEKNIWTANEGSPLTRFYQHNEYSRYSRFPSNIHFYCVMKATKGGATPISHSANVYERVKAEIPDLIAGVRERGLAMKMVFKAPGQEVAVNPFNWAGFYSFGQELQPGDDDETTKKKVEKQVKRLTNDFRWNDDKSLEIVQHIPGLRRDPANGRPTWFNGLVGRHGMTRDIGALEPPHVGRDGMAYLPCAYGTDTPVPREYLDKLISVIKEEEIDIVLEEGDLLLVDNFQVSHGREPWEGDRLILVSMWEGPAKIGLY